MRGWMCRLTGKYECRQGCIRLVCIEGLIHRLLRVAECTCAPAQLPEQARGESDWVELVDDT